MPRPIDDWTARPAPPHSAPKWDIELALASGYELDALAVRYGCEPRRPVEPDAEFRLRVREASRCKGPNCGTTTGNHSPECCAASAQRDGMPDTFARAKAIVETWPGWKRDFTLTPYCASAQQDGHCQCPSCATGTIHASDCAVHNAPAYPNGPCDCGAQQDEREALNQEQRDAIIRLRDEAGYASKDMKRYVFVSDLRAVMPLLDRAAMTKEQA